MGLKRLWLTYDLGIDGDYDTLYRWLDGLKAVECGDGVCSLQLDIGAKSPDAAVIAELKKLKIKFRDRDRIYLIWRRDTGAVTGSFIVGKRHRAPWSGYAVEEAEEDTDDGGN